MKSRLFGMFLVFGLLLALVAPASAQINGAIFTTSSTCSQVQVNIFNTKSDVYLNGGPQGVGGAGLPDGSYYIKVTTPEGAMLGKSNTAVAEVSGGSFVSCYQLTDILYTNSSGFTVKGYDDTTNAGGVYKVWASEDPTFPSAGSKTSNFKVNASVMQRYQLDVIKFYDANADGINNDGQLITGWKVNIRDSFNIFNQNAFTPVSLLLDAGTYTVSEFMPIQTNWMATTPTSFSVTLPPPATVAFGNLCLGPGGGRTLGFWSNNNGRALFGNDDLALMAGLNLRAADGSHFDPASYSAFRAWLLNATATNMAYMLSAQMAAMQLNVYNGLVNGGALIYAPGTTSANTLGFATVNAILAEANAELGLHGTAFSGDAWRAYQEALKNALDKANNNLNFVQPTPCPFSF